ncbi:hypothetical protein BJ138DRAFT_557808 [Hygrophoropsis aurantiaca]|uniref:Uncharacterized protein n=1 Tax=Hygrophoropsis aurantiaca TaxID=72124 RepID=A0ACB8A1A9_9AGAM|nr:hypothetical protein BJ138DRAFT_557808 [Hygrophoropsis aurantiaca]
MLQVFHTTWDFSPALLAFLHYQSALVDLRLSDHIDEDDLKDQVYLPSSFLPKLRSIRAPLSFIKYMIPGRDQHVKLGFKARTEKHRPCCESNINVNHSARLNVLNITTDYSRHSKHSKDIFSILPHIGQFTLNVKLQNIQDDWRSIALSDNTHSARIILKLLTQSLDVPLYYSSSLQAATEALEERISSGRPTLDQIVLVYGKNDVTWVRNGHEWHKESMTAVEA